MLVKIDTYGNFNIKLWAKCNLGFTHQSFDKITDNSADSISKLR